ncbi:hypothetical protein [Solwaraspora sp. WMMA2101]|uniref:hypothetical protein n=1 Tax=Solwaraspora sp. WMMA2101 TaxID=3404124 RepID=UPI003B92CC7B
MTMGPARARVAAFLAIGLATLTAIAMTGIGTASIILTPIGSLSPMTSQPVPVVPTTGGHQWITAPCAHASFGDVGHDPQLGMHIDVSATTCTPYKLDSAFAVATFRNDRDVSFVHGHQLVPYSPTGDTSLWVLIRPATPTGSTVCLLRTSTARLDCVKIVSAGQTMPEVEPVAVDDPLVDRAVIFDGSPRPEGHPMPGCANCVEAPS